MGAPTTKHVVSSTPMISKDDKTEVPSTADRQEKSLEATYTSLIQEYLQVHCLENATFLAERMVATSKTTNSLYLLAVCHYRSQNPQRALMVLDQLSQVSHTPSTLYLRAKCCCDLEQYGRAEESLLVQPRAQYKEYKASITNNNSIMTMDEWLLETSPCPVPNGAAGLYLLGTICRKSSRKQRAMNYFRMSLQVCASLYYYSHHSILFTNYSTVSVNFSWIRSCGLVTKHFVRWGPWILIQHLFLASVLRKLINYKIK